MRSGSSSPDADIVKISDNELSFLLGTEDPEAAAKQLFSMGCRLFLLHHGRGRRHGLHAGGPPLRFPVIL